jgi:cytochrome c553
MRRLQPTYPTSATMTFTQSCAACVLLALPTLAWCQAAPSGDPVAGQHKTQMCSGCHGIPGWRTAYPEVYGVPKIGGQHPAYIVKALQAYKSGERGHPSMRAIAASLSDQDMADLAAYYGGPAATTASK